MIENIKQAGWLDGVNGILIGRSCGKDTDKKEFLSYEEALHSTLDELNLPVLYDVDIGHSPPQMTLINGALGTVEFSSDKGRVLQVLK